MTATPALAAWHRRHLNESQRAMVAEKIANHPSGHPRSTPIGVLPLSDAARTLHVGTTSIQRAREVRRNGIPELAAAVEPAA